MSDHPNNPVIIVAPKPRLLMYGLFVVVVLFVLSIYTTNFHDRNYRQDEAWRVHVALAYDFTDSMTRAARHLDPPLWQMALEVWVFAFGDLENTTRFMSTLLLLLTLALTYRLAADLFNQQTALFAVIILGASQFFQFYGQEVRPYALLVCSVTAAQLTFLRWLRRPGLQYGLLFVASGIITIYTHFYGMFFITALAVYFVLFVRWQPAIYLKALGLFVAIGLSFLGWALPFLHSFLVILPGGINYGLVVNSLSSLANNLLLLDNQMQIRPREVGYLLFVIAFFTPVYSFAPPGASQFRFPRNWQKCFLLGVPLILLVIAFVSNHFVSNLTPRNLVVMLPSLSVLAAYGLYQVRVWRVQLVLVVVISLAFVSNFRTYIANGPYQEIITVMASHIQADDLILVDAQLLWQHVPINYYLTERLDYPLTDDQLINFLSVSNRAVLGNMPVIPPNIINRDMAESLEPFEELISNTRQVWYITVEPANNFTEPYRDLLFSHYTRVATVEWGPADSYPAHTLIRLQLRSDNPDKE